MEKTYCGYVPFKDEFNWWANFSDIAETCIRCNQQFQSADMDGALCRGCRAQVSTYECRYEAAMVEIMPEDEDWCEERRRVEAFLYWRGL